MDFEAEFIAAGHDEADSIFLHQDLFNCNPPQHRIECHRKIIGRLKASDDFIEGRLLLQLVPAECQSASFRDSQDQGMSWVNYDSCIDRGGYMGDRYHQISEEKSR